MNGKSRQTRFYTQKPPPPPVNKLFGVWDQVDISIYLDVNRLQDSTLYSSAVVIDYLYTKANPPIDSLDNCILNMYFDLCELERREMMRELTASGGDNEAIDRIYQEASRTLISLKEEFFSRVNGRRQTGFLHGYNNYIRERLGIDNLSIFQIDL